MTTYATRLPASKLQRSRIAAALACLLSAAVGSAADAPRRAVPAAPVQTTPICPQAARGCRSSQREARDDVLAGASASNHSSAGPESEDKPEYERLAASTPSGAHDLPDFQFNDSTLLHRLRDMRSLPVMTIWQSHRTQIYLGLNQKGLAGLHFRQRRGLGDRTSLWHSAADTPRMMETLDLPLKLRSVSP